MGDPKWSAVESAFADAAELEGEARRAYLDTLTDPEVRARVEALLDHHEPEQSFIEGAIGGAAREWLTATTSSRRSLLGERLGAYEITGVAGEGGMGAVYRARRADGQFEQEVAIKLVRHGYESATALDRFRQERQILARLTHPAIARLLDGGTISDEGGRDVPYLVMEFVNGQPITEYCQARHLPVRDTLALFRTVCDAVQHAHQQLIVHRDLKPGNILVTADGQPKLLDFGIAKLLSESGAPEAPALTIAGPGLLTPAYASPEQVTGDPITAATDVYALGAVLYELLTGQKAHRFESVSAVEISRVITEGDITRPSLAVPSSLVDAARLRRQLAGDLDTIVLKALRKEPERRYPSAQLLAADIDHYLAGRPVSAQPDTLGYRARKFVRRNVIPVAASVLVGLSLVGGIVATTVQARRAERRFQQVRKLANTVLNDLDKAISEVPGATRAREVLVTTASEYLASLAAEADGDPALQAELAEAYSRLGFIYGAAGSSNLGRTKEARESYERALSLAERARASLGDTRDRMLQVASIHVRLAELNSDAGARAEMRRHLDTAIALTKPVLAAHPKDSPTEMILLSGLNRLGDLQLSEGDMAAALASFGETVALARERMARGSADADRAWYGYVNSLARLAGARRDAGDLDGALRDFRESERVAMEWVDKAPLLAPQVLVLLRMDIGRTLGGANEPNLSDVAGADAAISLAREGILKLQASDPQDAEARLMLTDVEMTLAAAIAEREPARATKLLNDAAVRLASLAAADPTRARLRTLKAQCDRAEGAVFIRTGRLREAFDRLERAADFFGRVGDAEADNLAWTRLYQGDLALAGKRPAEAAQRYEQALRLAEGVLVAAPTRLASRQLANECRERLGRLAVGQRDCSNAQKWLGAARTEWADWANSGKAAEWATARQAAVDDGLRACAGR